MKLKHKLELSITQAEIAEYHECSVSKVRQALEDIFPEELISEAVDNYEQEIREFILEEIGNYID